MRQTTTDTVPRRTTKISLPEDVYEDAKEPGINFSQTCERAIRQAVQAGMVSLAAFASVYVSLKTSRHDGISDGIRKHR